MSNKDYEEDIQHRIDAEYNPELRGKYGMFVAIGAIANALNRIADALDRIYEDGLPIRNK